MRGSPTVLVLTGLVASLAIARPAAAKGGGIIIPPLEVDIGATAPVKGGEAVGPSTDILIGLHWASVYWKPTKVEVGIGYVGSFRPLDRGYRSLARMTEPATRASLSLDGGYLTLGTTIINHPHFRTWVEARGELLRGDLGGRSFSAVGAAVRFAAELYGGVAAGGGGSGSVGIVAGTFAIGIYIEASHRDLATELGPTGVTTGVSFRVPFVLLGVS